MNGPEYEKYLVLEDFLPENRVSILEYICPLCKGVLMEPLQDKKGHVFCKRCIEKHLQISNKCPVDDHEISRDKIDSIMFIINILEKQTVYCKNRLKHCEWKGNLKLLEPHLETDCEKQDLGCPNEGCTVKVMRQDMNYHLENCDYRLVKCNYCYKDACLQRLNIHYEDCGKYPLDCIQLCGKMVERCEMDNHIKNTCDNTILNCPYIKFGCNTEIMKKDLKNHLNDFYDQHNFTVIQYYEKFQQEVQESINKFKQNTESLNEKISSAEKKISEFSSKCCETDGNDVLGKKLIKNSLTIDNKNIKKKKIDDLDNKLIINY
jgi:hypothetical protein